MDFADGAQQEINFRPVLKGKVPGPLQEADVFNAVWLDEETGILQWPNGADFDPETLRNWPDYRDEFVAMALRWSGDFSR